jgi:hypothetical protein
LDDEFPWEEGLFGPIEAATEFDGASYFARSPSVSLLPATGSKVLAIDRDSHALGHWSAIARVAKALERHDSIDQAELDRLIAVAEHRYASA